MAWPSTDLPTRSGRNSQENEETNMEMLRKSLIPLYYDTLQHVDFIATTPVTAPRIAKIFMPKLVIFDEYVSNQSPLSLVELSRESSGSLNSRDSTPE